MSRKKKEIKETNNVDLEVLVNEAKEMNIINADETLAEEEDEVTEDAEKEISVAEDSNETTDEEDNVEDDCDIDDVITECTGKVEVKDTEPKKTKEPWFVARAKRINDYYNW